MKTLKKLVTVSFILGLSVLAVACGKQSATEDQKALPTTVGAKKSDPDDKGGQNQSGLWGWPLPCADSYRP